MAKESLEAVIPPGGKITYKLDAAIVRNTKKHHFCCCLTINGKDYVFDGVSHRRLQKYNWRKNLGKDKEWTFEGSEKFDGISDKDSIFCFITEQNKNYQ